MTECVCVRVFVFWHVIFSLWSVWDTCSRVSSAASSAQKSLNMEGPRLTNLYVQFVLPAAEQIVRPPTQRTNSRNPGYSENGDFGPHNKVRIVRTFSAYHLGDKWIEGCFLVQFRKQAVLRCFRD